MAALMPGSADAKATLTLLASIHVRREPLTGGVADRPEGRGQSGHVAGWCKQGDIDAGRRPGTSTAEASKVKDLEREVRELKRANEILLAASSFFARELDPRLPW